jgi:hypothetical protein
MNVLILTPDRVGSTLLQRLITVHMQSHDFGKPVINLHELTNGLTTYYNQRFNQTMVGRNKDSWGYHQSLQDIVNMLDSADHFKTARLAHYHILGRRDSIDQQLPFYRYLNENFFIISARRNNLLEHALSWCIFTVSKKLNVYGHEEKIDTFAEIYRNSIHVDQQVMTRYLDAYLDYIRWSDDHFDVSSYFDYEKDLANIETYINNLNLFGTDQKQNFWRNIFNMDWKDWNLCHYLISDLSTGGQNMTALPWQKPADNLPVVVNEVQQAVMIADNEFLQQNISNYLSAEEHIQRMVTDGILATCIPIKLQTLIEKKHLIKNFQECLDTYNAWAEKHKLNKPLTAEQLTTQAQSELANWHAPATQSLLTTDRTEQLK